MSRSPAFSDTRVWHPFADMASVPDALAPLADHPLVAEVRGGTGLLAAVEFEDGVGVNDVFVAARERGVLARPLARALAFSPPLTITPEQISAIGETMRQALDEVLAQREAATAPAH